MAIFSTKSKLHKRFSTFVTWVAPKPNKREDMKRRAQKIREKIRDTAIEDGLVVMSTPKAGSFYKKTGLRRHYRGESYVDGQDIDLPFVIKPQTKNGKDISSLLDKFQKYAKKHYDDVVPTKSSIQINFPDHVSFDLVPMLATDDNEKQLIIRKNGEQVETSVQKHVSFIRDRMKDSDKEAGRVLFNECVRLFKWWKEFQADKGTYLYKDENKDNSPSSFLINLLCAKAYDKLSVYPTYAETMAQWSSYIADVVRERKPVHFTDFTLKVIADKTALWSVIDPVNKNNNIVAKYNEHKLNELAEWFEEARDNFPRIIRCDKRGQDSESLTYLVELFGNPFKNNCEN